MKKDIRNIRTENAIKDALLQLLKTKNIQSVSVSEVVRQADISRSTFYAHYNNLGDVYEDLISDFMNSSTTLLSQLTRSCDTCNNKLPFCENLRNSEKYRSLVTDPQFLTVLLQKEAHWEEEDVFCDALAQKYDKNIIANLRVFQLAGCYTAALSQQKPQDWPATKEAIDIFIRGGLAALRAQKYL